MRLTALIVVFSLAGALCAAQTTGGQADKDKKPPKPVYVITGTVFTPQGFALPGASIRVRRAGEKKPHWEATSDRRGEFGVRVPPGVEYEIQVTAKGFQEQTQKVDAKSGTYENLVFHMVPVPGGKKQ